MQNMKYDVFISHASEDKDLIVRPLVTMLEKLSVRVWYDEFSLKLGDSLSASIDKGLLESRFGIVVLSKSFLKKNWTDYEYRSLLSRQMNGQRIIIPLGMDVLPRLYSMNSKAVCPCWFWMMLQETSTTLTSTRKSTRPVITKPSVSAGAMPVSSWMPLQI